VAAPTVEASPPEAPPRPRRRWPRRLLIGLNIFLALCIVATGGGYLYLRWRFGQIPKVDIPVIGRHGKNVGLTPDVPAKPMNVLLVGSDSRQNLTGADCKRNCRDENGHLVTGQRSDTIMILHADPQAEKASILSIPRDLWVTIAGTNRRQRINTAFDVGPTTLIQTITNNLGVPINHYVEVDFIGFRNLVNQVGGVPIYVPAPARDFYSDLRIPTAGCIALDGNQALGWVRSRHYQYYEAGRWHTDPSSDFGRIKRQQDFIRRLMKKAISRGIRNPIKLNQLLGTAVKNVTIDKQMSTKDIFSLGKRFRSLDPQSVAMYTLPVDQARIGGADVLRLKEPDAQQVITLFQNQSSSPSGGAPVNLPTSAVRVRTLNGTGQSGVASRAAAALSSFGFQNVATGDADAFTYSQTVIRYGKGQRDKARLMQAYLKWGATLRADPTLTVDVVLVVGRGFAGVAKPASTPAANGAATTAAPTTSTTQGSPVPVPKGAPPQPQC